MSAMGHLHQRRAAALVSAVAILVVVAAFTALFLSIHATQLTDYESGFRRLRAEAAAVAGTHLALWRISNDTDLQESLARPVFEKDTSFDADPVLTFNGDLAGATFQALAWPGDDTVRLKTTGVSGGVYSARWAQMPLTLGVGQFEAGLVKVGGKHVAVSLSNTYTQPVVVCTIQYRNNRRPVVPRVRNAGPNSFEVCLVNPSGREVDVDVVSYLVMEQGVWTFDGVKCEAQLYKATVTDWRIWWRGQKQTYGQKYTSPVVIGQVMTENDADWSVFWCCGSRRTNPPSAGYLWTGKTVCEDWDITRAAETVGFIVFEAGHAEIAGVEFEAALGKDTIRGIQGSPPYTYSFTRRFSTIPQVALASMAGVDGFTGGWAYTFGALPATQTTLFLAVDEDQIRDKERAHTTEQLGYVVFESSIVYP